MSPFLSIHWDVRSSDAVNQLALIRSRIARKLPTWHAVLDRAGLLVLCPLGQTGLDDVQLLDENRGLVFGTLFLKPSIATANAVSRVSQLDRLQTQRVLDTQGRSFVSDFWGSYIAIFSDRYGSHSRVLRSPLGRLKCFYTSHQELTFFFSRLDDYSALELAPLTVNWDCIRAQAACADYLGRETAINAILALEGGECAHAAPTKVTREFYWHPCEIAKQDPISDFEEAAVAVRSATQMCVQSWALRYRRITHRLSGGLDSSISVSCVRKVLPRSLVTCLNFFSQERQGDERTFARDVARHVDAELLECERDPGVDLEIFRRCERTAWPVLDFSGYGQYLNEVHIARQRGANAIFCGELGDNLFENGAGYQAPADYVWRHALGGGLLRVAMECAARRNYSIWKVLRRAIADGFSSSNQKHWSSHGFAERQLSVSMSDIALVRRETLDATRESANRFIHPWFEDIQSVPPAKFLMIYGMIVLGSYQPPFATEGDPPLIAPLASQPLAEVCLRIPTYLNNRGGINRATARRAFADELPSSVLTRTSKGTPEPWTREVVQRNESFLRSFLLDGVLVSEGILDRKRLEDVLSSGVGPAKSLVSDLIVQLYIEAWVRRWPSYALSIAA